MEGSWSEMKCLIRSDMEQTIFVPDRISVIGVTKWNYLLRCSMPMVAYAVVAVSLHLIFLRLNILIGMVEPIVANIVVHTQFIGS